MNWLLGIAIYILMGILLHRFSGYLVDFIRRLFRQVKGFF